ncbi:MAG: HAD family hydrolase [Candidatus Coatesbacteria bacterium]
MPPIRAVTFDLWDTVFLDDSDEPKRKAMGLPPKKVERRDLVERFLGAGAPARDLIDRTYDETDAEFRRVWHDEHVTWTVADRLRRVLAALGRDLPPDRFIELVRLHEDMELRVRPDLVPGAADALRALHGRRPLIAVSDAIFSPGRALREILDGYGLLGIFGGFVFSDECGRSKPHPEVFRRAAALVPCRVEELVHVGDREHNDVGGPHAVGARAILLTAGLDRGSATTKADAICRNFLDLAGILESLDGAGGHP